MLLNLDGTVLQKRVEYLTPEQVRLFAAFDEMARHHGLGIFCARCTRLFGPGKDGVRGDSNLTQFRVYCGCTERVTALAPTSGAPQ